MQEEGSGRGVPELTCLGRHRGRVRGEPAVGYRHVAPPFELHSTTLDGEFSELARGAVGRARQLLQAVGHLTLLAAQLLEHVRQRSASCRCLSSTLSCAVSRLSSGAATRWRCEAGRCRRQSGSSCTYVFEGRRRCSGKNSSIDETESKRSFIHGYEE